MLKIKSPTSIEELMNRARALAGLSFAEIAEDYGFILPGDLKREKGLIGQLIEVLLGATAKSAPTPDFPELHVELKTLPIDQTGKPCESTFVCSINYHKIPSEKWENSLVWRKLRRVLWLPVEDDDAKPLAERRIGTPLLWQPNPVQTLQLKQDWIELTELIILGRFAEINAYLGEVLQIRPKAANARALTSARNEHGEPTMTLPRGFYLRAKFTAEILKQFYVV